MTVDATFTTRGFIAPSEYDDMGLIIRLFTFLIFTVRMRITTFYSLLTEMRYLQTNGITDVYCTYTDVNKMCRESDLKVIAQGRTSLYYLIFNPVFPEKHFTQTGFEANTQTHTHTHTQTKCNNSWRNKNIVHSQS